MKKIIVFTVIAVLAACKGGEKKETDKAGTGKITIETEGLKTHYVKINNINDEVVTDSIWKMMFKYHGINELLISKTDSVITFKVHKDSMTRQDIINEVTRRGGEVH